MKTYFGLWTLGVLAACINDKPARAPVSPPPVLDVEAPTGLPAESYSGGVAPRPGPSGCVWAMASDAVVWGTLTGVRMLTTPAWRTACEFIDTCERATCTERLVDTCDGYQIEGLELDLSVERVFWGTAPAQLTVRMGSVRRWALSPTPMPNTDAPDGISWPCNDECRQAGAGALRSGGTLGLPLHYFAAEDVWSPLMEAMLFQDLTSSGEYAPTDLRNLSAQDLGDMLSSCTATDGDNAALRRDRLRQLWTQTPDMFMAARCSPNVRDPDSTRGECLMSASAMVACENPSHTCVGGTPPDCIGHCQ
jgi:hypothetical protein